MSLLDDIQHAISSRDVDWMRAVVLLALFTFAFELIIDLRQLARLSHAAPETIPALQPLLKLLSESEGDPKRGGEAIVAAASTESDKKQAQNILASASTDADKNGWQTKMIRESQAYAKDKLVFSIFTDLVGMVESALIMLPVWSGETGLKKVWDAAGRVDLHRIPHGQSLLFLVYFTVLSSITSIPESLYKTFVLEEKHGFNKTTFRTWLADLLKGYALSAVFLLPILAGFIEIVERTGKSFVQYTCLFVLVIQLLAVIIYPYVIAPLFNKFTHIKDSPYASLQPSIEKLAKRLKFPLKRVWVIDGSKRSGHSNAFFFGIPGFTKHIVLYDTLLQKQSADEVEAVVRSPPLLLVAYERRAQLAHELGHWKHNDSLKMLLIGQANVVLSLSLYGLFLFEPSLYRAWGFSPNSPSSLLEKAAEFIGHSSSKTGGLPIVVGFMLAGLLLSPLDTIVSFGVHWISRQLEFRADAFARSLGYKDELQRGLAKLLSENKGITDNDPLYSAMHHSHPTVQERLEALSREDKKAR